MGIPQIIMIVIFALAIGINLTRHGEPRDDKYNFWTMMISVAIQAFILYCGGFFG